MRPVEGYDSSRHFKGVCRSCKTREGIQLIKWVVVRTTPPYRYEGREVDNIRERTTSKR